MRYQCPPVTEELLASMVRKIVDAVHPRRIIMFGSRARGTPRPDSDIDLMVVVDEPFSPTRKWIDEVNRIYTALQGTGVPHDILLYSVAEFEKWRDGVNHVVVRAVEEGRVLYERS
ncbi:MAG: nucleotidyltransferase domain-containing protein [Planctomycetes bacterium]|nr:nucleotidyltransferase domain-containing protein [Planctomycetota bacterium]